MTRSIQPLSLISSLASSAERRETALALAAYLGAEDLIVFILDPEIEILLPAPGFTQTLQSGQTWQALLKECTMKGQATSKVPFSNAQSTKPVTAIAGQNGASVCDPSGRAEAPFLFLAEGAPSTAHPPAPAQIHEPRSRTAPFGTIRMPSRM